MKKYDVVILGSGPVGIQVSSILEKTDLTMCIIEAQESNYGGTCVNHGCMPTKQIVKASELAESARKGSEFGVSINNVSIDMENILGVKTGLVQMLSEHHKQNAKCDVFYGYGRFKDNETIQITMTNGEIEDVQGKHIIIGTGSRPKLVPNTVADGKYICTSDSLLNNNKIPDKLLIVGAGVIGCEFASIYNNFGSKVTLIEAAPHVLPNEDVDTSVMMKDLFSTRGIKVSTSTFADSFTINDSQVCCKLRGDLDGEHYFDQVLIGIGRMPNTDDLGLENTDIQVENDFIKVNDYLQTDVAHIYAGGDTINTWMLAHTAAYEGSIIARNILVPESKKYTNHISPRVIYSSPEVATVGLTEKDASLNHDITVTNFPMFMSPKAIIEHAVEGRIKLIINEKTGHILGANIIGKGATELIHELTLAVTHNLTLSDLQDTIHAHPTLSEGLWFAALNS